MGLERAFISGLGSRLFGSSPRAALEMVRAAWAVAMGPELARRTEVLALEGGTLRVRVPDGRWRQELHRMQPQILGRLRGLLGELAPRRLGFSEGPVPGPPAPPEPGAAAEASPPPPALAAAAEAIADLELRARFLEAAGRYLARATAQRRSHA